MEDDDSVSVLKAIHHRAELGTHLHSDFVAPDRRLTPRNMAGRLAATPQSALAPHIERRKLENITSLFHERFGYRATSFRAGRFALGAHTYSHLAALGYIVDSSVTPGIVWNYDGHLVDYRGWSTQPRWIETEAGRILELPLAIRQGGRFAKRLDYGRSLPRRVARFVLGERARMVWLRPSFFTGSTMVRYVQLSTDALLVVMLHSVEIVPGSSPYARTRRDVVRIVDGLKELFEYCQANEIGASRLSDAPALI
jgi:hypothetical protein